MEAPVSPAEIKRAEKLHAMLLFDFIVIHVFYFVLALGLLKSSIMPLALMPVISVLTLGYVLFTAQRAKKHETSFFVRAHMGLAAKRGRLFLLLFLVTGTFTAVVYFGGAQFGISKVASYALAGGVGQLPFMVALLTLVVMEYDAAHQCKLGKIPAAALPKATEPPND